MSALAGFGLSGGWQRSSSGDRLALDIVDGTGRWAGRGPHYSRRSPGSKTFTGVGQEIVLLHESLAAVWACVRQKTPARRGSGASRDRSGAPDPDARWIWRNLLFRRFDECPIPAALLVVTATASTFVFWREKYGTLPEERLRTEIGIADVRSTNPGACYRIAGYTHDRDVRGKCYLWAPEERESALPEIEARIREKFERKIP